MDSSVRRRAFLLALPALPADLMLLMHLFIGWEGVPLAVYDVMFQVAMLGGALTVLSLPFLIGLLLKNVRRVAAPTTAMLIVLIAVAAAPLMVAAIFAAALYELSTARW